MEELPQRCKKVSRAEGAQKRQGLARVFLHPSQTAVPGGSIWAQRVLGWHSEDKVSPDQIWEERL